MREASLEVLRRELASDGTHPLEGTLVEITRSDNPQGPIQAGLIAQSPLGLRIGGGNLTLVDQGWLGVSVQVRIIYLNAQIIVHHGVVVDVSSARESRALSIRITSHPTSRLPHIERRRQTRWLCSDEFHPTGVASNPAKFNDFIVFRIMDVSISGMRFVTSLRNNFIVRGMKLDVIISFPMVSQITVEAAVQNVSFVTLNEKEYLSIGVQIKRLTDSQASVIAQYMSQFGDIESLREFHDSGFVRAGILSSIEYGVVRTEQDYREVLNLRHLAYQADHKIGTAASVNDVSDIHDSRARILTCKFRGKTIATARLTFHEAGDITEHEEFVSWPSDFPRRDESVEVTRACTHPDFRRTGLFFALLRYVVITATQAGRILGSHVIDRRSSVTVSFCRT